MKITARLEALRAREHTATVEIIEGLIELKRSQEYLALGYASIWDFLVQRLHYSNAAASRRYKAMKCAERFPQVLTMLREHRTSLSALAQAEATLERAENPEELLAEIDGQPAREVERAVARRNPIRKRKEQVRRKYVRETNASRKKGARVDRSEGLFEDTVDPATSDSTTSASEQAVERVLISFSLSPADFEDLEEVRSILSRKLPEGVSVEDAFRELMAFFLKHKRPKPPKRTKKNAAKPTKRKSAQKAGAGKGAAVGARAEAQTKTQTKTEAQAQSKTGAKTQTKTEPQTQTQTQTETRPNPSTNPRRIPKPLRDRIWRRDQGRCTYVGRDGHRCDSRHDLQIDHIRPVAAGGTSDEANLRLLCANHNRYRTRDLLPTRKSRRPNARKPDRAREPRPTYGPAGSVDRR